MAIFIDAYHKTLAYEGGWVHDPDDPGGETYRGISRVYWPKWSGWATIDSIKKKLLTPGPYGTSAYRNWVAHFNDLLASAPALQKSVEEFYRIQFWDKHRLGEIDSQDVAEWAYDHAVNAGSRGVKWMQAAAGVSPDGMVGSLTLKAVNESNPETLLAKMKSEACSFRLKRVASDPSQKKYLRGWLRRDGYSDQEIKEIMA